MKRVLVLIHLASAESRMNLKGIGPKVMAAAQDLLGDCTAVFASEVSFGFAGTTDKRFTEVFETFVQRSGLRKQDNISVLELGTDITSSHPGLREFHVKTQFLAFLSESAKR